jgi:uncharacterized cupin superfamily protein
MIPLTECEMPPILNIADISLAEIGHGESFSAKTAQFGPLIGMKQLGCRLVVVPPGKKAWPYHSHQANEEMFVVLEGQGTLRHGGAEHPVKPGDVIACPAGGPETAHQLVNTGGTELRYLAISTMLAPEVCEYPDSGKFSIISSSAPGGGKVARRWHVGLMGDNRDYWEGEE